VTIPGGTARKIASILLCMSLFSCVSVGRVNDVKTVLPRIEELENLAAADPVTVLENISRMSQSAAAAEGGNRAGTDRLAAAAVMAGSSLASLQEESSRSDRLDDALRYASSLFALSQADTPVLKAAAEAAKRLDPSEMMTDLLFRKAENLAAKGYYAPAVRTFLKVAGTKAAYLQSSTQATAQFAGLVSVWMERARTAGDSRSLELLARMAGQTASNQYPGVKPPADPQAVADWARGVVTVYIDKGLRISGGMAVPDRVLGSAFQIDAQGYYLTNYHVIASEVDPDYEGYSKLSVRPSGNPEARVPAKVIGWNVDLDIALIKSTEISPRTFFLPDEAETPRGSRVFAIGSPIGLENSISSGIVSASGRRLLPRGEVLQIDVPVNPGNSGGPLLDEQGRLVGMVFAGLAGFQGLNFAMPVKWIDLVLTGLFEGGKVENPWLGLVLAKNLDSSVDILWEYPEARQFVPGDRLVSLDGIAVTNLEEAQSYLASKPMGSLATVKIRRSGSAITLLGRIRPAPESPLKTAQKHATAENLLQAMTGMLLDHISGRRGEGGTYQVLRTWPGLPADESGISQGDTLKFVRYAVDIKAESIYLDVSVKSRVTGYLEKTLRLALPLETSNFL